MEIKIPRTFRTYLDYEKENNHKSTAITSKEMCQHLPIYSLHFFVTKSDIQPRVQQNIRTAAISKRRCQIKITPGKGDINFVHIYAHYLYDIHVQGIHTQCTYDLHKNTYKLYIHVFLKQEGYLDIYNILRMTYSIINLKICLLYIR